MSRLPGMRAIRAPSRPSYRLLRTTLRIELSATTDKATPVNLCHHSYFNLDGGASILDHTLEVAGDFYTPTDDDLIPTGEIRLVAGTPYDFRSARPIRRERSDGGGLLHYDVNFMLRRDRLQPSGIAALPLAHAGTVRSPANGLSLAVWTTEPGLQVYDGAGSRSTCRCPASMAPDTAATPASASSRGHGPDSPNNPQFPNTVLRPGEVYRQVTEYRFE